MLRGCVYSDSRVNLVGKKRGYPQGLQHCQALPSAGVNGRYVAGGKAWSKHELAMALPRSQSCDISSALLPLDSAEIWGCFFFNVKKIP